MENTTDPLATKKDRTVDNDGDLYFDLEHSVSNRRTTDLRAVLRRHGGDTTYSLGYNQDGNVRMSISDKDGFRSFVIRRQDAPAFHQLAEAVQYNGFMPMSASTLNRAAEYVKRMVEEYAGRLANKSYDMENLIAFSMRDNATGIGLDMPKGSAGYIIHKDEIIGNFKSEATQDVVSKVFGPKEVREAFLDNVCKAKGIADKSYKVNPEKMKPRHNYAGYIIRDGR